MLALQWTSKYRANVTGLLCAVKIVAQTRWSVKMPNNTLNGLCLLVIYFLKLTIFKLKAAHAATSSYLA